MKHRIYQAPVAICRACTTPQPYVAQEDDERRPRQCRTTWHARGATVRVTKRLAYWYDDDQGGYAPSHPMTLSEASDLLAYHLARVTP